MVSQTLTAALDRRTERTTRMLEGYWLANRDDCRRNYAEIAQRLDATTAELDAQSRSLAEASVQCRAVLKARSDVLAADLTASPSTGQLLREIVPIVLTLLPVIVVAVFWIGGFS